MKQENTLPEENEKKKKLNIAKGEIKKVIKRTIKKPSASAKNTVTVNRLKLLICAIPRNKAEYFADLIKSFDVNMQMTVLAEGTADRGMLASLGINQSPKAVIFSVIQENKIADCTATLQEKFDAIKGGKGIAFAIPLTSVIGTLIFGFLSNDKSTVKEERK